MRGNILVWTFLSSLSVLRCQSQSIGINSASDSPPKPTLEFEGARECPQGSDKLLSDCFKLVLKDYDQWASAGISALEVGSTDPVHLPDISFRVVGDLRYTWTNIRIYGGTQPSEDERELEVNTKNRTLYLADKFPLIRITADYNRTGHFLWLSLRDTGNVELNITNVRSETIIFLKIAQEDGGPVLRVHDIRFLQVDVEDVHSHVQNLAEAGLWGQIMNSLINRNIKWIFKSFIEPVVRDRALESASTFWRKILPATLSASYFLNS